MSSNKVSRVADPPFAFFIFILYILNIFYILYSILTKASGGRSYVSSNKVTRVPDPPFAGGDR